jgi:L-rhamnose isomerase
MPFLRGGLKMEAAAVESAYSASRDKYAERGVDTDNALERLRQIALSPSLLAGGRRRRLREERRRSGRKRPPGDRLLSGKSPQRRRAPGRPPPGLLPDPRPPPRQPPRHVRRVRRPSGRPQRDRAGALPGLAGVGPPRTAQDRLQLDLLRPPLAASGYTLSSRDNGVRKFWVDHVKCCRKIAASIGREQQAPCLHDLWIPDGSKDVPADRWGPRARS